MSYCEAQAWRGGRQLPPGILALVTNSRVSALKSLWLDGLIDNYDSALLEDRTLLEEEYPEIAKQFQPFANYCEFRRY